jgi:hypothetical protein
MFYSPSISKIKLNLMLAFSKFLSESVEFVRDRVIFCCPSLKCSFLLIKLITVENHNMAIDLSSNPTYRSFSVFSTPTEVNEQLFPLFVIDVISNFYLTLSNILTVFTFYFKDLLILLPNTDGIDQEEEGNSPELVSEPEDEAELVERGEDADDTEENITNDQRLNVEKQGTAQEKNKIDTYVSTDPSERRQWEVCEKPRIHPKLSIVWNYFLVYKDHQDFRAGICKTCYNQKKDSSTASPFDWECPFSHSSVAPQRLETHLRRFHSEVFRQFTEDKEKMQLSIEVRRTWKIGRKNTRRKNRSPIWNYFYVYTDHPEFRGVICKLCYDMKKTDTKALPSRWEHYYGSKGAKPAKLTIHLQNGHPEIFEEYKNISKTEITGTNVKS